MSTRQGSQSGRRLNFLEIHRVAVQIDHGTNLFEQKRWCGRWYCGTVNHDILHYAIDASHTGANRHLSQHLGFASNAHCLVVGRNDTRFESKLVEESLFGLTKRTNVDDSTLCSCVSKGHTWIDLNPRESVAASSLPLQRGVDRTGPPFIVPKKE